MDIPIKSVLSGENSTDYFSFGRGERPLVILPGLSMQSVMLSAGAVSRQYDDMADAFTIYLLERRRELPARYTVGDAARDTAAAIKELGVAPVCLFGASYGGMTAMCIAARYPELVEGLAVGSSCARVDAERYGIFGRWADMARRGERRELYVEFAEKIYPAGVFSQNRDLFVEAGEKTTDAELGRFIILAEGLRGFDITPELRGISCPVLVLGAADDALLGPDAAYEIFSALGERDDVEMHLFEGCGHAAYDTAPDYRQRLLAFFNGR